MTEGDDNRRYNTLDNHTDDVHKVLEEQHKKKHAHAKEVLTSISKDITLN